MRVPVWCLLCVMLCLAPVQQAVEVPETSEESAVAVVEVPILATGRDGAPVTDLRVDELEVYEDGKRQEITVFVMLAAQTGGSSYRNLNDFSKALGGVSRMTSVSYLLAYKVPARPKGEKPDQFHRIGVRTTRRDVELKYRAGYLSTLER